PPFRYKVSICSVNRIGVNPEASRKFAAAGHPLVWLEIFANNGKPELRYELLSQGNITVSRKPHSHFLNQTTKVRSFQTDDSANLYETDCDTSESVTTSLVALPSNPLR